MRLLPSAEEAEQKRKTTGSATGVSSRAETLRNGLQAIVAGDTGTRLTLLSKQGLTLSSEAGRRLYACCKPDVRWCMTACFRWLLCGPLAVFSGASTMLSLRPCKAPGVRH